MKLFLRYVVLLVSLHHILGLTEEVIRKSNSRTSVSANSENGGPQVRNKRQAANRMTQAEIDTAVNKHNALRAVEGSSNMEKNIWNPALAEMAQLWADRCAFAHGQPSYNNPPFDPIGQNLYLTTASTIDLDSAIQAWYDEKPFYDFDTMTCDLGEQCGHYTQVVWSSTKEIGCAYQNCPGLGTYLVCNYGPAGNYVGEHPFKKGPACTRCDNGKAFCNSQGLCNSDCTNPGAECQCRVDCENCGMADPNACTCSCMDQFIGHYCENPCQDNDVRCATWPDHACDTEYFANLCPAKCTCTQWNGQTPTCTTPGPATSPTTSTTAGTGSTTSRIVSSVTTRPTRPGTIPTTRPTTTRPTRPGDTTTTTTTTTMSTISTTETLVCDGSTWQCQNGGTKKQEPNRCVCICNPAFYGNRCELKNPQKKFAMKIQVTPTQASWPNMWNSFVPMIANAVNDRCNRDTQKCCENSRITDSGGQKLVFTANNYVTVGSGYPKSEVVNGRSVTTALVYAQGIPSNELCNYAVTKRKKRSVVMEQPFSEHPLSQEMLYDVITSLKSEMTSALKACCNSSVIHIEVAQVEETAEVPVEDQFSDWVIGGIAVSFMALTGMVMIGIHLMRRSKNTT